ncbi:MAG: sugar phosphate isomerase/epimerase family protein, partial [Candidatus Bathyarchaeia archaeon]
RLEEALKFLSEVGYDGVDGGVDPQKVHEKDVWKKLSKMLSDYDLKLACIFGATTFNSPDPAEREQAIELTRKLAEIASMLSCENILIGGRRLSEGVPRDKAWKWAVESIRKAADYAREKNVDLAYEYWNRFETNFIKCTDDVIKLINEVGRENLYAILDTFHMNIEEKSFVEPVKKLGKKLKHVHLSESNRLALGDGHIDFPTFLSALKDIGYDKYLCVEVFYYEDADWPQHPFETAKDYALRSIKYLRNLGI